MSCRLGPGSTLRTVVLDALKQDTKSGAHTWQRDCAHERLVTRDGSWGWGRVYVIAGFTECSRRKLLARADDVRYNNIYIYHDTAAQL